jgi:hypothetical protein
LRAQCICALDGVTETSKVGGALVRTGKHFGCRTPCLSIETRLRRQFFEATSVMALVECPARNCRNNGLFVSLALFVSATGPFLNHLAYENHRVSEAGFRKARCGRDRPRPLVTSNRRHSSTYCVHVTLGAPPGERIRRVISPIL